MIFSRPYIHRIIIIVIAMFHLDAMAQDEVMVTVNRDRILIGEQLELTLRADVGDERRPVVLPSLPDSLNHLEVIRRGPVDSLRAGERFRYTQVITLTSFDSGRWVIAPLSFGMRGKRMRSDSVAIHVNSVPLRGKDYNDIREIIDVENAGVNWGQVLLALAGAVLILTAAYYWYKRRKSKPVQTRAARAGAYEEAIASLKKLQADGVQGNGAIVPYYSRLYDIFRVYYSRMSGYSYMHSTTDEFLLAIRERLPADSFSRMAEVLRITDAVKFARYGSSLAEAEESLKRVRAGVDEINKQPAT